MAACLLAALLPMLTFVGHWPAHLDIPGTDYYVALPFAAPVHSHQTETDHGSHCHANSASCTDKPVGAGVGFALLNESLAMLGAAALLIAAASFARRMPDSIELTPEPGPPKCAVALV